MEESKEGINTKAAIDKAKEAAIAHDLRGMLAALFESGFLEGLARRLRWKWEKLSADEIDFIIAEGVDILYRAVSQGKAVLDLPAYLFKVCENLACDRWQKIKEERIASPEEIESNSDSVWDNIADDDKWEEIRPEAMRLLRNLLPRLGQENIQKVMCFIFDCVEEGIGHISNDEIADALDLSEQTVRTSKSRGFRRLARIAQEEGITRDVLDIARIFEQDGEEPDAVEQENHMEDE